MHRQHRRQAVLPRRGDRSDTAVTELCEHQVDPLGALEGGHQLAIVEFGPGTTQLGRFTVVHLHACIIPFVDRRRVDRQRLQRKSGERIVPPGPSTREARRLAPGFIIKRLFCQCSCQSLRVRELLKRPCVTVAQPCPSSWRSSSRRTFSSSDSAVPSSSSQARSMAFWSSITAALARYISRAAWGESA